VKTINELMVRGRDALWARVWPKRSAS